MRLWILILAVAGFLLEACDRTTPQRSSANEGSAAQSAAGGSANEGRAVGQAAGR